MSLVRKTFAVTRSVTVSQPAVPLRVVEVIRADDGTFVIVEHACVGIETRLVREYSAPLHPKEYQKPRLLDARTLREDGWRFDGESVEHYPMWIDREFGVVTMGDNSAQCSNVSTFATYTGDPDYDAKLADAKESLELSAKAKGGAAPETPAPAG